MSLLPDMAIPTKNHSLPSTNLALKVLSKPTVNEVSTAIEKNIVTTAKCMVDSLFAAKC